MKGFELTYKNYTRYIAVEEDGVSTVHLFYVNGDGKIMAGGQNRHIGKRMEWINESIKPGDEIQIRFTEVEASSEPLTVLDITNRRKSKLEQYLHLKNKLTEKGVL